MGLDCSHDAFHGAYSSFNRFRQVVAKAIGGSFPPHDGDRTLDPDQWYWGRGYGEETHPGLLLFFQHSDCDGELSPAECSLVANDLEALMPNIAAHGSGTGHIARDGGYGEVAKRFIAGCRDACEAGESLLFG